MTAEVITPSQFAELKAMLDADAGKERSANGAVASSLRRILARHQEMVLAAERGRLAAVMSPAALRLIADWFDADDALKAAQFPTLDRGQTDEVQRDLRRFADLLEQP